MAKKEIKTGQTFLDEDLDFPEFDFDVPPQKDDRKPITKVTKSFIDGFKSTISESNFIKQSIRDALPDGFQQAFDLGDNFYDKSRQLYDKANKTIRPAAADLARALNSITPEENRKIKGKLAEIEKWKQSSGGYSYSKDKQREDTLGISLGEIFKDNAVTQLKIQAQQDAKDKLNQGVSILRHKDMMQALNASATYLDSLRQYELKITSAYQKKSLELQYRQHFLLEDILIEAKKAQAKSEAQLDSVIKNTALPESVKLTGADFYADNARNKFWSGITEGLFGGSNQFFAKFAKNIGDKVNDQIESIAGAFGSAAFAADSIASAKEMQENMGVKSKSKGEFAAEMAGGFSATHLAGSLGEKLKKLIDKNKTLGALSRKSGYFTKNAHQLSNEFKRSDIGEWDEWDATPGDKIINASLRILKDLLPDLRPELNLQKDSLRDLNAPHFLTRQSTKTINEIIPGYLSRIFRELQIIRTGDSSIELTTYDYSKNKFSSQSVTDKSLMSKIVTDDSKEYLKGQSEELLAMIDKDNKLSPDARQALKRKLIEDNLNNRASTYGRLTKVSTYNEDYVKKHAKEISGVFKDYFGTDSTGEVADKNDHAFLDKQASFSDRYSNLGRYIEDSRGEIQNLINLGMYDLLVKSGVVDESSSKININKVLGYNLGDEFNPDNSDGLGVSKSSLRGKSNISRNTTRNKTTIINTPYSDNSSNNFNTSNFNSKDITDSIERFSTKTETQQILDILKESLESNKASLKMNMKSYLTLKKLSIFGGLGLGIDTKSAGSQVDDPEKSVDDVKDNSIFGLLKTVTGASTKLAGKLTFKAFSTGHSISKKLLSSTIPGVKLAVSGVSAISSTATTVLDRLNKVKDVFIEGQVEPVITAAKLKAGNYYRLAKDGRKILVTKITDIKDTIYNEKDEVVLSKDDIPKTFTKTMKGARLVVTALNLAKNTVGFINDKVMDSFKTIPKMLKLGINTVKGIKNFVLGQLDKPIDIYVGSSNRPVMLARIMKTGGYFSQRTRKPIMTPNQIDGPVINYADEVVLTEDDLREGIFDKDGKPIRSPLVKLKDFVFGGVKKVFGAAKWAFNKSTDMVKGAVGLGADIIKNGIHIGLGGKKSVSLLEQIRDILDNRLPGKKKSMFNDSDGDGVREGSWKLFNKDRKGGAKKNEATETKKEKKGSGFDLFSGIGSIVSGLGSAIGLLGKGVGLFGQLGKIALTIGKFLGGGMLRVLGAAGVGAASSLLGAGSAVAAGVGALGTGAGVLAGGTAAVAGSVATGAVGLAGSIVGGTALTAAAGISGILGIGATILSSPVVLGAGAVALAGYGAYKAYKYFTRNKASKLELVRYAQYGFDPKEKDKFGDIFALEQMLIDDKNVVYDKKGNASLTAKDMDVKKALSIFGVDKDDKIAVEKWLAWFLNRFKPVFLTHLTAINGVDNKLNIKDVDKLEPENKLKYLNAIKFPNGPYNVKTSPYPDMGSLPSGSSEVEQAFNEAKEEIEKTVKKDSAIDTGPGIKDQLKSTATGLLEGAKSALANFHERVGFNLVMDKALNLYKQYLEPYVNAGMDYLTKDLLPSIQAKSAGVIKFLGFNVDTLESIRFRVYGLRDMSRSKVMALRKLEQEVFKVAKYQSNGEVTFETNPTKIFLECASDFGISDFSKKVGVTWYVWFKDRFLPVFLTYLSMVKQKTGKQVYESTFGLQDSIKYDIAQKLVSIVGIWKKSDTPWEDYKLEDEPSSVDGWMHELKKASEKEKLAEKAPNTSKVVDNKTTTKDTSLKNSIKSELPKQPAFNSEPDSSSDGESEMFDKISSQTSLNKVTMSAGSLKVANGPLLDGLRASQYLDLAAGVDINNLHPEVLKNLKGMVEEYGTLTGKKVPITSGHRDRKKQEILYNKDPKKAAPPGQSLHEYGLAFDMSSDIANELDKLGLMRKYGFTRPVGGEPWHVEPSGIQGHIDQVKRDIKLAADLTKASINRGGGGLGTISGAPKYKRDSALALQIFESGGQTLDLEPLKAKNYAMLARDAKMGSQESKQSSELQTYKKDTESTRPENFKGYGNIRNVSYRPNTIDMPSLPDAESSISEKNIPGQSVTSASKIPAPKPGSGYESLKDTIEGAAKVVGVNPEHLKTVIAIESSFDPNAKAKTSSAAGLGQHVSGTWNELIGKYGSKYGLSSDASPFDPMASSLMTAEYIKQNTKALGGNASATDIYMAHFLGAEGAKKFLSSSPDEIAATVLPSAAKANKSIFYDSTGKARTISEVYSLMSEKVKTKLKSLGVAVSNVSSKVFDNTKKILTEQKPVQNTEPTKTTPDIKSNKPSQDPNIMTASYRKETPQPSQSPKYSEQDFGFNVNAKVVDKPIAQPDNKGMVTGINELVEINRSSNEYLRQLTEAVHKLYEHQIGKQKQDNNSMTKDSVVPPATKLPSTQQREQPINVKTPRYGVTA